ncbi:MAG: NAD-dependent epimerase/dehydratase family protein [Chloroflexi bacterium]|jgi:dihydroflavonol-4-reductase|nr:NAD-dependent epimerase/dehydratase family protein [Chloroflexota bacterium]MBT3669960.1 NAD-dependent epimerase/dehydratase family protein [Chloroflexota bacterium]MBT4002244.1 NAD-dependent epimerase/dehydratase family protein [Chloroflexota bacterium]MBT4304862.1 NAD-dependent epimerase/dehydratase family protein [Chloroflexota bacterium]MBT4534637.1 NAD-dependent epimerase/dehydratase family protein [Chloroflexota bacterium]
MKKVLVLGATGFIGGHIAKAALAEGWQVVGFRRQKDKLGHLAGMPILWMEGDLNDPASLKSAMQECEIVFHAAAFYPKKGQSKNVIDLIRNAKSEISNVLDMAVETKIKRLVFTSTLTTIGKPPTDEDRLANEMDFYQLGSSPKSGYAETKSIMEHAVIQAANEHLDAVIVNPTAVFGPGDVHITLGSLLIATAKGWMKAWLPGQINVVDVRDVARAHIVAAIKGKRGERYILGGRNYSVREALTIVAETANVPPPKFHLPIFLIDLLVLLGDLFPFLSLPANHMRGIRDWQGYDISKAEKELDLEVRYFEDTVRDALSWFKENGHY